MATSRIVSSSQVFDRLPQSSWYRLHPEDFDDSDVLLLEGDVELAALDLDAVLESVGAPAGASGAIGLLMVTGSLSVSGAIYNAGTHGAVPLVVLGDLRAGHMIVGGQVIHVVGHLHVGGLFWGDYNHGTIKVEGQASAQCWLATDEYHCELAGAPQVAGIHWNDDSYDAMPPPLCGANLLPWFPEELVCLDSEPDDSLNQWLDRDRFVAAARGGRALLVPPSPRRLWPVRLASGELAVENLQSLLQTPLREGPPRTYLVQLGARPFFRLSFPTETFAGGVYFEVAPRRYFVTIEMTEPGHLQRALGRKPQPVLVVEFTDQSGEDAPWRHLSAAEIAADSVLQHAWCTWLAVLAEVEPVWQRLSRDVTVERLDALRDLPFVHADFHGYGDDHEVGPYTLAIRQASEGTPTLSLGWMGSEQCDEDGDPEYCWALFKVETHDGVRSVAIDFQPATSDDPKVYDARLYLRRLPEIERAFHGIEAILAAGQQAKAREDENQAQDSDATRRERWEACVLPGDGWLDVPLRQDHPTGPTQRFRLATPYEVKAEVEALTFNGERVAFIDGALDSDEDSYFLVMDEDCALPCLEMDTMVGDIAIAGYLFRGNLTLTSHLFEYDSDVSPLFVVWGDLTVRHTYLGGNVVYVGGDLRSECVYGFYNHGCLVVSGALRSEIVIAKDFDIRAGQLFARALQHLDDIRSYNTVLDAEGNRFGRIDGFPATCRVTDILPPELCSTAVFWKTYFPEAGALLERMRDGAAIVDPQRLDELFEELPEALPRLFDWVFAGPRLSSGRLIIRGDDESGDFAYATVQDDGARSIGLNRGGGYNYQLFIRQTPDGLFEACHWVAPSAEGEPGVMYSEPVASRRSSPMAAKHAFYVALERLALLPYRAALPVDAPIENADSVREDIAGLERYLGDAYEGADTLAYHLTWLWPKTQAFFVPADPEITLLLEWSTVAYADNWSHRDKVAGYAKTCLQRVAAQGHTLRNADRFLGAVRTIAGSASDVDAALALLMQATGSLVAQASAGALLLVRQKQAYLLHEARRYEEAQIFNRRLLADAEAQLGSDAAGLCPLLINLAQNSYELGDIDDAQACLTRTLSIGTTREDAWAVDQALFQLGVLSHEQGDDDRAKHYLEQRLAHAQATGQRAAIAAAEASLKEWAQRAGRE